MAQVEIVSERDSRSGWTFTAQVLDDGGSLRRHEVSLSWADYNLWSGSGADEPAEVAAAAVRFILSLTPPDQLPARFDASTARRMDQQADEMIPPLIHRRR